ncbi:MULTISPECIES: hypothetical protein [unclassified Streptomyces]|uniref:hypothetical protein n=1 Tax=unclassified Streptomyces TaxID=2593676 RepID=UPI000B88FFE5|nr:MULTISPECIES: hypothetical protein [unclassified Streptomyces]MYZ35115.1 hypothetical protein [Streptomyces sp. SID4917]
MDLGWLPLGVRSDTDDTPFEEIWLDEEFDVQIRYVEDLALDLDYLILEGPDIIAVERKVYSSFLVHSRGDVMDELRAASAREARIASVYRAAVLGGEQEDPDLFGIMTRLANDPERDIRHAVIVAGAYLEWLCFRPLLDRLRENDPEESVRRDAGTVLDALDGDR